MSSRTAHHFAQMDDVQRQVNTRNGKPTLFHLNFRQQCWVEKKEKKRFAAFGPQSDLIQYFSHKIIYGGKPEVKTIYFLQWMAAFGVFASVFVLKCWKSVGINEILTPTGVTPSVSQ